MSSTVMEVDVFADHCYPVNSGVSVNQLNLQIAQHHHSMTNLANIFADRTEAVRLAADLNQKSGVGQHIDDAIEIILNNCHDLAVDDQLLVTAIDTLLRLLDAEFLPFEWLRKKNLLRDKAKLLVEEQMSSRETTEGCFDMQRRRTLLVVCLATGGRRRHVASCGVEILDKMLEELVDFVERSKETIQLRDYLNIYYVLDALEQVVRKWQDNQHVFGSDSDEEPAAKKQRVKENKLILTAVKRFLTTVANLDRVNHATVQQFVEKIEKQLWMLHRKLFKTIFKI